MKKTVKSLIIAASVAAIAGIGAVSFAAWNGGNGDKEVTTTGALGDVKVYGFGAATTTAWTGTLVPYDQPANTIATGGVTIASVTLPSLTAVTGQKVTVKAELQSYTASIDTAEITYKNDLYVVASETAITDPSTIVDAANKIDATNGVDVVTTLTSDITDKVYTLYFALDSNDYAAKGLTYNITVTLSDPA